MNKTIKLLMAVVMMALVVACSEQSEIIEPKDVKESTPELPENEIYVTEEGILNFSSMELFTQTIERIKGQSASEVIAWTNSMDFRSYLSYYEEALAAEAAFEADNRALINAIISFDNQEEADEFQAANSAEIEQLNRALNALKAKYGKFAQFSNNRITGMKTYDHILAGLINADGIVIVQGSALQYTDSQLKVMANAENPLAIAEVTVSNEAEGIFVSELTMSEESGGLSTEQEQIYRNRCETQFHTNRKMTGNSAVINTVVPRYRQEWVPRRCEWYCDDIPGEPTVPGEPQQILLPIEDDCYEVCTGGYYRNILLGYDVTNTRLEAVLRNYKITCFIGCWENWDGRYSFLTISGVHSENVNLGYIEKKSWIRDISPRSSGSFTVAYESNYIFPYDGYCVTTVNW